MKTYYTHCQTCGIKKNFKNTGINCYRCANKKRRISPQIRFWNFVTKTENCWEWNGFKDKDGYGSFKFENLIRAHRVSWKFHFGDIPKGKWILHKCDNPPCVRPDHLWIGTADDNNKDTSQKGHTIKGEKNKKSKLTEEQVKEIRANYIPTKNGGDKLASKYGITKENIYYIIKRKTWKHI